MKILIALQGRYGERMRDNIRAYAPTGWEVAAVRLPADVPMILDDPEKFLPSSIPTADLLIALPESASAAQLIPDIAVKAKVKAVIAAADDRSWLPAGLARQTKNILTKSGVDMAYPVPFCSLTEKASDNPLIQEFARRFGMPDMSIDAVAERIKEIIIVREAPCGNTRFVASGLAKCTVVEAVHKAGLLHHQHPCLAAMAMDEEFGDTLMHRAALFTKQTVEEALK